MEYLPYTQDRLRGSILYWTMEMLHTICSQMPLLHKTLCVSVNNMTWRLV